VSVTGQVGCLTIALVVLSVLAGRWLDTEFGVRPWFTIGLLVASVPVALFLTIRLALRATHGQSTWSLDAIKEDAVNDDSEDAVNDDSNHD